MVVLSSVDAVREAFVTKQNDFAGRAQSFTCKFLYSIITKFDNGHTSIPLLYLCQPETFYSKALSLVHIGI